MDIMVEYNFQEMFPTGQDKTDYRLLTKDHVSVSSVEGLEIIKVAPEGLTLLAQEAFRDVSHLLRPSFLDGLAKSLKDPKASDNDKYVLLELLKNAAISAEGEFPLCQDTGTAIVIGKKGHRVWTDGRDEEYLSRGVFNAYGQRNFRYSQNAPLDMYNEKNTGTNLPAQVELYATGGDEYKFLFIAKGGGSSNKTALFQETKATLNPDTLPRFLINKMRTIGTAACPPYHLAFVIGGTSPELTLKTVKLASAGYLDDLPLKGNQAGQAFRDRELEGRLMEAAGDLGLGAQFGGRAFCLEIRVIRLPRHGASCPIGMGVSCNAHRNMKAKISREGIFLEKLETNPAKYLPQTVEAEQNVVKIDLDRPMSEIRAALSLHPVATRVSLTGKIVVARDIAHARLKERVDRGEDLPSYFKDHIIFYAGPSKTPPGYASGSLGPTTAGRMDDYVPIFQKMGGSLVMLAKGNRTKIVKESCQKYGGFYLGSIGGPAARLAKDSITHMEVLEYPELGMEAVYMITVKDFPAFIIVDDKGNDFYEKILS